MDKFLNYLQDNCILFDEVNDRVVSIGGETFHLVEPVKGVHFDKEFKSVHESMGYDNTVILFGGRYYFYPSNSTEVELNELRYIGEYDGANKNEVFLGVHGSYEMMGGTRNYKSWVKKAKWMGIEALGLCELNTLAGLLKFQEECLKMDIKPILGATFTIERNSETLYGLKFYVENEIGWSNLLTLNYLKNVEGCITEQDVIDCAEGLIVIIDPKTMSYKDVFPLDVHFDLYYQFDLCEYVNGETDLEYLKNIKGFLESGIRPVSITDAYYIDKEDVTVMPVVETIGGNFRQKITGQHLRSKDEYFMELFNQFKDEFEAERVFNEAVKNESIIARKCGFKIDTKNRHLPMYEMTNSEVTLYGDKENMFFTLIQEGLDKLYPDYTDEHWDRIDKEVEVLELGNVVDYFLMTRDIINAANKEGILSGIGRGSAGGSIISYLLGIIRVDPLEFNLIFERFLNKGRVVSSLPDIDSDFEGAGREWVKLYMERRFGKTQVCSVGTYSTLQLKGAIKDVFRVFHSGSEAFEEVNIATSRIKLGDSSITDLFKRAADEPKLYRFIHKYPYVFHYLPLVLGSPKSQSVHACAMIIFPTEKPMHLWTPVYKNKDGMIITAFEGGELDSSGFLKQDILGIKQLDKFKAILQRIELNGKEVPDIYNLPFDDRDVYRYFARGWNGDVFQFGSSGLTGYTRKLKPHTINDLIACVALYRPGTMENGFHEKYVKRKHGEEEVDYMWGTEEILKDTYGLLVYQEQIMNMCTDVAGFDLVTADDIRKAMGKKKLSVLLPYKEKFINGAIGNGCPESTATEMWEIMLEFAKYSFNLSHSAAYAITGYISQWLKVHYPLEYWATTLSFANQESIPVFLSEIQDAGTITISPPEINKSGLHIGETKDGIFWSLASIKGIGGVTKEKPKGGKAIQYILNERNESGRYGDFQNFMERCVKKGTGVNKTVVEGLILSGAFDEVELITNPKNRGELLERYWEFAKTKMKEERSWYHINKDSLNESWVWMLKQKDLSGLAFFNYQELNDKYLKSKVQMFDRADLLVPVTKTLGGSIGGVVIEAIERKTKKGDKFAKLLIESNYSMYNVMVWGETYGDMGETADSMIGGIVLLSGEARFDAVYSSKNQIQTTSKTKITVLK
jgi:DNA polymerase-3 subunit alpha